MYYWVIYLINRTEEGADLMIDGPFTEGTAEHKARTAYQTFEGAMGEVYPSSLRDKDEALQEWYQEQKGKIDVNGGLE